MEDIVPLLRKRVSVYVGDAWDGFLSAQENERQRQAAADEIESLREELQQLRAAYIELTQHKQITTYYGYK